MILEGKGAAPGIAVGRIYLYNKNYFLPQESFVLEGHQQSQLDKYLSVKKQALIELEEFRAAMQKHDPQKAQIFLAHQEIVNDIVINEEIPSRILNDRWAGDWAIYQVYETVLIVLKNAPDVLIAARADDFDDVRSILLRLWYGIKNEGLSTLAEPVIIAAQDLMPSDTASMDNDKVLALLTATGSVTSHTAIIAKSYGIPAVMGITDLTDIVKHGQLAIVNADEGQVILDPENEVVEEYEKRRSLLKRDRQDAQTFLYREGRTSDGEKIDIGLNITNGNEVNMDAQAYTDYVGLFRTEFLYMERNDLPGEEEQLASYRKILEHYGQKPVILRTMDIGGDKPISSVDIPHEENPFLGNRALRFCFSHPDIFRVQIRAALRASVYGNLMLMLPMVCSIEDIRRAKDFILNVTDELKKEGKPCAAVKIGTMVEIPSIALVADKLAKEVDFASIGTNDLCQYLCAADRMNSNVEPYYQSYHPALFKLIDETVRAFDENHKPVSICGELASDEQAIPLLIGLGLRKFSMGAASIASFKRAISTIDTAQCREIAIKALKCATAQDVKELLSN